MSAEVIPFPLAQRRPLVSAIATSALNRTTELGEKHIAQQLKLQAIVMLRKGVSDDVARRELARLEASVRALMWNAVMSSGEGR